MTVRANGAKYTGKFVEFEMPDAAFRAVARGLTDGRIVVEVQQRFAGVGAWCNLSMEEWNGDRLAVWGSKTAENDMFPVGPGNVPMNEVVSRLNAGIKSAIEGAKF